MGTDDLFKRRRAKRQARKAESLEPRTESYLIVCEGEKTEPQYFDALAKEVKQKLGGNLDVPLIETSGEGRGTVRLVEKAGRMQSTDLRLMARRRIRRRCFTSLLDWVRAPVLVPGDGSQRQAGV